MKQYEDLTFTDDFMFCKILQQDEDLCKRLVEVIIGKKIGKIIHDEKQRPIEETSDGKGIRMDVYLEDDQNSVYNIEMQNVNAENLAKRARYYQSMLDVDYMERGWEYEKLKKSYIIFINQFDMFGKGLAKYTFTNRCHEEPSLEMGDETTKIFLNSKGVCDKMEPELKALLSYMSNGQVASGLTKDIDNSIIEAKKKSRWKGNFMTLYEHYQIERKLGRKEGLEEGLEQGLEQGRKEAKREGVLKVVKNALSKDLSLELACEIAGVTIEEYNQLKAD